MLLGKKISFCGVFAALSLLLLYLSSVAPSGKLALIAASSYCVGMCVVWCGLKLGILTYAAVALLSFIILPNIMLAILFTAFFGCYPIIKLYIEKIQKLWLEWIVKILFFNTYLLIFITLFKAYVNVGIALIFGALNIAFIIYDIMFNYVITKVFTIKRGRSL